MAEKWIQGAVEHAGSLRARAAREGLLKPGETLTAADLDALYAQAKRTKDSHLLHQVLLARTLKGMH